MFAQKLHCIYLNVRALSEKVHMLHLLSLIMHLELLGPKQFDGTCSNAVVLKALCIIHGLPVTDCMTSDFTGMIFFFFFLYLLAFLERECMHTCKNTHTHTQHLLGEDCLAGELCASLSSCSWDGLSLWLFQGVREKLLWWLRTAVWSLCEHAGCLRGCHRCTGISSRKPKVLFCVQITPTKADK